MKQMAPYLVKVDGNLVGYLGDDARRAVKSRCQIKYISL